MLEHLIGAELEPVVRETPPQGLVRLEPTSSKTPKPSPNAILDAQVKTSDWLEATGLTADQVEGEAQVSLARDVFSAISTGEPTEDQARALLNLTMPYEVRHLVGMLTAYDWEFVKQAKELRTFVVSKLIEESTSAGKAGDRIKALGLLGKVTEIGLFTDKVEVKNTPQSDEELDARIKERINKLRGVMDVVGKQPVSDVETLNPPD